MQRFKNILYVAGYHALDLKLLDELVGIAERNDAQLTLLVVVEEVPAYAMQPSAQVFRQAQLANKRDELDSLAALVSGRVEIETKVIEGTSFLEITREVLRHGRDLVVKSAQSEAGVIAQLFGTNDLHLLRKCPCPVWLVKPASQSPIRRVLAAVDFNEVDPREQDKFDPLNKKILELAGSLASLEGSELHVAHAWFPVGVGVMQSKRTGLTKEQADDYFEDFHLTHQHWLDRLMDRAVEWIGRENYNLLKPKAHLLKGNARNVIPSLVDTLEVDLVVMGTVGRTGVSGLLMGNTAESILHQIDCSVLAIKPDGFETPVTLEEQT